MRTAVVIGAGGGIGAALVTALASSGRYDRVHALSRRPEGDDGVILSGRIDVTDEATIASAAASIASPVNLAIIATGMLVDDGRFPERALRELDPEGLARMFAVNTIGPALVLKYFAPLLPKDGPAIIAALSARVGSISDNRTGGWYGYRASKAALNMIVKSAAIEIQRSRPQSICIALHPGTVDTPLSAPFQARVPRERLFTTERAAGQLIDVLDRRRFTDTGRIYAWDGSEIEP